VSTGPGGNAGADLERQIDGLLSHRLEVSMRAAGRRASATGSRSSSVVPLTVVERKPSSGGRCPLRRPAWARQLADQEGPKCYCHRLCKAPLFG